MNVMTDQEVRHFLEKNSWADGIQVAADGLYYDSPEADCIVLPWPETPLRVTFCTRVLSVLGTDECMFNGALLWLRLWDIGSSQLEKSGWRLIERMRMGFGELRPLGEANGHWFREDEVADLAAFLVPCFVYGWDAYVVPANFGFFSFVCHDEFWCVVTRDYETRSRLLEELKQLKPQTSDRMRERFCKRNVRS